MPVLTHDDITHLTPSERLTLIADLWDSLSDADLPVTGSQRQELARRLTSFEEDRAQAVPWKQLKADLAARVP